MTLSIRETIPTETPAGDTQAARLAFARLDESIASSAAPQNGLVETVERAEPAPVRWPGYVRLAIFVGAAGLSWALALSITSFF